MQRLPRKISLGVSDIRRCELSTLKVREEALRRIKEKQVGKKRLDWKPPVGGGVRRSQSDQDDLDENVEDRVSEVKAVGEKHWIHWFDEELSYDEMPLPLLQNEKTSIQEPIRLLGIPTANNKILMKLKK